MKKNYIVILVTLLISLSCFSQTKSIPVNIDIRGRDCNGGIGLCSITKSQNTTNANTLMYITSSGELVLEVNYSKIPDGELKNLLGEPYKTTKSNYNFTMVDDLVLNEEILNRLALTEAKGKIRKGYYSAIVVGEVVVIKIPLTEIH